MPASSSTPSQYRHLRTPSWAPPPSVFGPVWTVLYCGIAVSFGALFVMALRGEVPWVVTLPFALNLVFNFAFTPIQFGLRNNALASADILAVLATLLWATLAAYPYAPWIAWAQLPYLLWVSFATVLQLEITKLNG
jgi:tryptophan-rich sensory protein